MRRRVKWAIGTLLVAGAVYLNNASWLAARPTGTPELLAHRGLYQTYDRQGLTRDTCTASRIHPPTHPFFENTIPSMGAAFALGADALELDVHPTTDGEFAVFHDWTLDCRTNGKGVTRKHSMADLKKLDIGWGYTADGGRTFPFRGKGVGLMPTLDEVLKAFPDKRFLINTKSRDPREGPMLVRYLQARDHPTDERLWVFAHDRLAKTLLEAAPRARVLTRSRGKSCVYRYLALGWSGYVPQACRGSIIGVPLNFAPYFWGWPNRFMGRMADADVRIMMVGPFTPGDPGVPGFTSAEQLDAVPEGFSGLLMTDEIGHIGAAARQRWKPPS